MRHAIIVGAGIGGMATAIRLAKQGKQVSVFEKNAYPGGKLCELNLKGYRFDKGPSLLTMPHLIDELTKISESKEAFNYHRLETITKYFFEDGIILEAKSKPEAFAQELHQKINENKEAVINYLKKSKLYYQTTAELFLNQSLSEVKNFLNFKTFFALLKTPRLNLFSKMNEINAATFKNKKTVQIFNRYATYNGSNPYKAPALLNMIPHLEFELGAFFPEHGMHQITNHLYKIAIECGVKFNFNASVQKISHSNKVADGIVANDKMHHADYIICDADIHTVYNKLLLDIEKPKKLLNQEKSSSAFVFYWAIAKEFKELDLHNILFSENYEEEFEKLFESDKPYHDPTVYINISSKHCKSDAPIGCENWFVMVNVPHNQSGKPVTYGETLRTQVIQKINRILKTQIENYIVAEEVMDPYGIEMQTSSYGGSLYGNSSNNRFSAFLRHSNFSKKIKNLYFVGGSVHPGGGIPLCLLSAKIVSNKIASIK